MTAAAATDAPPAVVTRPTITGDARLGGTLTVSTGNWSGTPPFGFAYQWLRCRWVGNAECSVIPGGTGTSYTVGPADEIVAGAQVGVVVAVAAANYFGQAQTASPLTWLDTPLAHPTALSGAFQDAMAVYGSAGEIPSLLAHNGYTAMYPALRTARVKIAWGLTDLTYSSAAKAPRLATGQAVIHAGQVGTFRVQLTKFGRRALAGRRKRVITANLWYTPLGRNGRPCCGSGGTWGAQAIAFQIVLSASGFETRQASPL